MTERDTVQLVNLSRRCSEELYEKAKGQTGQMRTDTEELAQRVVDAVKYGTRELPSHRL